MSLYPLPPSLGSTAQGLRQCADRHSRICGRKRPGSVASSRKWERQSVSGSQVWRVVRVLMRVTTIVTTPNIVEHIQCVAWTEVSHKGGKRRGAAWFGAVGRASEASVSAQLPPASTKSHCPVVARIAVVPVRRLVWHQWRLSDHSGRRPARQPHRRPTVPYLL